MAGHERMWQDAQAAPVMPHIGHMARRALGAPLLGVELATMTIIEPSHIHSKPKA